MTLFELLARLLTPETFGLVVLPSKAHGKRLFADLAPLLETLGGTASPGKLEIRFHEGIRLRMVAHGYAPDPQTWLAGLRPDFVWIPRNVPLHVEDALRRRCSVLVWTDWVPPALTDLPRAPPP